ncbi:hypothetical protein ACFW0H_18520 [Pseudomonas sp. CR3202]|uniref:hypothetical protein n=1 Tax=Pseudomonas sp. CR3202 TaxID=3351532 RepID=UPI003BF32CAE
MIELALAGISLAIWLLTVGVIITTGIVGALPFGQEIGRRHQLLLVALCTSTCILLFLVMRL